MIQEITQNHPKGEHKYKELISGVDGYKNYKKQYPNSELTRKEYSKILEKFFEVAKDYILDGKEFKIPHRMGYLRVIKVKGDLKKLKVDWKATNELWKRDEECRENKKLVYHLNEHSGGDYYRVFWKRGKVKNISAVTFLPIRSLKSAIAAKVKKENKDYLHRK